MWPKSSKRFSASIKSCLSKRSARLPTFHILLLSGWLWSCGGQGEADFVAYEFAPGQGKLQMYYKDKQGRRFASLQKLKQVLEANGQTLLFATNGGMYTPDHTPKGLYREGGLELSPIDTTSGEGNFYLQPNGVFYLTRDQKGHICPTLDYGGGDSVQYATQSGPMLLLEGKIPPAFEKNSANRNIRNAVGTLPDGVLLFVQSKRPVTFYELAAYFQQRGCLQALYLDGLVSRTYQPPDWMQTDGDFGVMIGVTK